MNQPSEQFKSMTRKLLRSGTGTTVVSKLHPTRDWLVGVLIGILAVMTIISWSAYTYVSNRDGGFTDVDIVVVNPTYKVVIVEQALEVFAARATNFSAVTGTVTTEPVVPEVVATTTEMMDGEEGVTATTTPAANNAIETSQTDEASLETDIDEAANAGQQVDAPVLSW